MGKFLRYIRRNTLQVVLIILFIIFIYSVIHVADNIYKNQAKNVVQAEEGQEGNVTTISSKDCEKTLKTFLEYCTEGEYEKAYNYLSEESKENFPTIEDFKNNYYLQGSLKGKGYSIEKASEKIKNRYKITFNNLLSSGNKNQNTNVNYYIVVQENEDLRIKIER